MHGHAVVGGARLEAVGHRQRDVAVLPDDRAARRPARRRAAGRRGSASAGADRRGAPSSTSRRSGGPIRPRPGFACRRTRRSLVADEQVAPSGALLELGQGFRSAACVVAEEVVPGVPVTLDRRGDRIEGLAGHGGSTLAVADPPTGSAAIRTASPARRPSPHLVRVPLGLAVACATTEMRGQRFDVFRIDRARRSERRGGLVSDLGPPRPSSGAGVASASNRGLCTNLRVARPGILARVPLSQPDMGEQTGHSAACTLAGSAGRLRIGGLPTRGHVAMLRSWPTRSCHSRIRR